MDIEKTNNNHNKDDQIGGKLLNEGGFGCIFKPSLKMKNNMIVTDNEIDNKIENERKRTKKYVKKQYISKIQVYDEFTENEYKISKKITKIKNYKSYFAPVINEIKNVELAQLKNVEDIRDCDVIQKHKREDFLILKVPFVGQNDLIDYFIQQKNKNSYTNDIIYFFSYLQDSIHKLVQNKIVHFDLKGNNVMIDDLLKIPIIIDFGISIDINQLENEWNKAKKSKGDFKNFNNLCKLNFYKDYINPIWSFEIILVSHLVWHTQNMEELKVFIYGDGLKELIHNYLKESNNVIDNYDTKKHFDILYGIHKKQLIQFSNMDNQTNIEDVIMGLIQSTYHKWDMYSLFIMMKKLIEIVYGKKELQSNKFLVFLLEKINNFILGIDNGNKWYDNIHNLIEFNEIKNGDKKTFQKMKDSIKRRELKGKIVDSLTKTKTEYIKTDKKLSIMKTIKKR